MVQSRVCDTCRHWSCEMVDTNSGPRAYSVCLLDGALVGPLEECRFKPSRWEPAREQLVLGEGDCVECNA